MFIFLEVHRSWLVHIVIRLNNFNPFNKITDLCLSVCTEPIWFSFKGYLYIDPGKVYNYFRGEYHQPTKIFFYIFFLKLPLSSAFKGL